MLSGIARLPFGFRSPPPDHRRSGRQSHRPWPLSGAKPRSTDRIRNAGTHWQATVKPLPLVVFLSYSPTTGHLPTPRLQPFLDQAQDPAIGYAVLNKLHRPFVTHIVKGNRDTLPITST